MVKILDCVVVGSGCAGSMVAQTLVEGGETVTMLDVGAWNKGYKSLVPNKSYITIRKSEANQHEYFIGKNAEGIPWGDIGKGAQVTPGREHMTRHVKDYLQVRSNSFSPLESLGYGGLGIGWGLQSWEYSSAEMSKAGLKPQKMFAAYNTVAARIGISAQKDDAAAYTIGQLEAYQPPVAMDRNHRLIYKKYESKRHALNKNGFYLGRTPLALLTKDKEGRSSYKYRDMDYYSDNDQSAWRPWITVNMLKRKPNFTYTGNYLVTHYIEKKTHVQVHGLDVKTNKPVVVRSKKLVLAVGALGSARIALRSSKNPSAKLPILCNPYTYIPCVQPRLVGMAVEPKKLGLAQLSLFYDEGGKNNFDMSVASLYSYQSLMLFRVIKQLPFNFVDARVIMRWLMTGIEIMGVHHPDSASKSKYLQLTPDKSSPTGDTLKISYKLGQREKQLHREREKKFCQTIRKLGTFPIAKIDPGMGSSIHYAGTLPYSSANKPLTLSKYGKLHGTKNVYVADSSGFNYLPAKGLTFSLMANAHVIANGILNGK